MSDDGPTGGRPGLAAVGLQMSELSRVLLAGAPGSPDPERVVRFAAAAVAGAEDCGLTLVRGNRQPATVASATDLSPAVDSIQYATGEGPCLEASEHDDVVHVPDLATDGRWPEFAERCVAATGVRSLLSVRLFLPAGDRGALNLYSSAPAAFDQDAIGTAAIFAPFAAMALRAMSQEQEVAHLQTALRSSRQIGTAMGILMARQTFTAEQAFAQLVDASQHLNRKLRDIAAEVAETGTLPAVPPRRGRR